MADPINAQINQIFFNFSRVLGKLLKYMSHILIRLSELTTLSRRFKRPSCMVQWGRDIQVSITGSYTAESNSNPRLVYDSWHHEWEGCSVATSLQ